MSRAYRQSNRVVLLNNENRLHTAGGHWPRMNRHSNAQFHCVRSQRRYKLGNGTSKGRQAVASETCNGDSVIFSAIRDTGRCDIAVCRGFKLEDSTLLCDPARRFWSVRHVKLLRPTALGFGTYWSKAEKTFSRRAKTWEGSRILDQAAKPSMSANMTETVG